jgi:hypothetical protein
MLAATIALPIFARLSVVRAGASIVVASGHRCTIAGGHFCPLRLQVINAVLYVPRGVAVVFAQGAVTLHFAISLELRAILKLTRAYTAHKWLGLFRDVPTFFYPF